MRESSKEQQQSPNSKESSPENKEEVVGISSPHGHDVLCGRGVTTNRHKGNEKFRELVDKKKNIYVDSTKRQKMSISRSIVNEVRNLDPPGRFLEKNPEDGLWYDIGDKKASEKTAQALRDRAATFRKQLNEEKSQQTTKMDETRQSKTTLHVDSSSSNANMSQGHKREENFMMDHMSQAPFHSIIKQKTSFDPSVKGWGSYYGQPETMNANPMKIGPNMMRRNRHRRSSSTPDARERNEYRNMGRDQHEPLPSFNEFSFKESMDDIFTERNIQQGYSKGRKRSHRRANTLPTNSIIESMNELNDFEPIPFSRRNRRQSLDDEKRLSRDIFDPEFMKAIFGSEQKIPYSNENDEPRMSFHAHHPDPKLQLAHKSSNSKVHSTDWNREGKQQKPHHRKRTSGDFSDGNFSSGAFCEPFKDLSTKTNAPSHRKTKSTPIAFTSDMFSNPLPPSKKYRPVVSRESGSSSHLQHNKAPPSPRVNSPIDLTRAQFSYIAQGSQYHSDSYMSEGNVSPPDPQEYLYDESIEVTRFSEKEINEPSPTTVYDEECLQVDQKLFDLI